jgi:hypothetical protein
MAKIPVADFVTDRSGTPATGVPFTTAVSLAKLTSPGVLTHALLLAAGSAAAETNTVNAIEAVSPAFIAVLRVQVTSDPAAPHVKSPPDAPTYVSPVRSESCTVIVPVVGDNATCFTVRRYVAF